MNLSNRQAVANLVMAVASYRDAQSVVGLSNSPVFHHQFSSISKAIINLAKNKHELKRVRKLFREQWLKYFPVRARNHFQPDVAVHFLVYAEETLELLAKMPFLGTPRDFRSHKLRTLRMWHVKGFEDYLIFYRPIDDGVEIFRVLHGKRDIEAIFNDED